MFYQQIYRLCHYILHQVAHIDCSAPSGKQHEPPTGVSVIEIHTFSFKKMDLKMVSVKWQPSCPGLNVLRNSMVTDLNFIFFVSHVYQSLYLHANLLCQVPFP